MKKERKSWSIKAIRPFFGVRVEVADSERDIDTESFMRGAIKKEIERKHRNSKWELKKEKEDIFFFKLFTVVESGFQFREGNIKKQY